MATFETFYDQNPIRVIDQNTWTVQMPEVAMQFRMQPVVYTPLVDWTNEPAQTGAQTTIRTELLEGDIDSDEIPFASNYIDTPQGVDSRFRKYTTSRYGDKVMLHKTSNIFQQWRLSGGRDWRPLLRGMLGQNVINKHEILSRNAFLRGPKAHWTYGGNATDWNSLGSDDKFGLDIVNAWNLRLGQTGSPVIPGDMASAKLCMVPPGCTYDFMASLAAASSNEAALWRDAQLYAGQALRYEMGAYKNVRFIQVPSDRYGFNPAVLYNCGAIVKQYGVTSPINAGDGSPDPETTAIDDVWYTGQKDVTHYLQLENFSSSDYNVGDIVTIHVSRTSDYGVTNGVDPLSGKTINRKVVAVDASANTISLDRPVMFNYKAAFAGKSVTGNTDTILYAYVTRAKHVGFCLALGSRGGILGGVAKPLEFYEPVPVDDFQSVWRYVWDAYMGFNVWEPDLFEPHFVSVTLPKPGGLISP